jgi:hypothetical protein
VVSFWRRTPCLSVDGQRYSAQLNRQSLRRQRRTHRLEVTYFVGYAPRWISLDRLYLIVGLPGSIMGLRVGGQLVYPSETRPTDSRAYFKQGLASQYEGRNLLDPLLASLDPRNFLIPSAEFMSAHLRRRRALWTGAVPNVGTVMLRRRNGRDLRFILIGEQNLGQVVAVLSEAGVPLESAFREAAA